MNLDFFTDIFTQNDHQSCMVWQDISYQYGDLLSRIAYWKEDLISKKIQAGDSVALLGDFSLNAVALLFALIERDCISVPLLRTISDTQKNEFFEIAHIQHCYTMSSDDSFSPLSLHD